MKRKSGVSMISLIITIIIMSILAGVVIVQVQEQNPVDDANEATFKSNIVIYVTELNKSVDEEVLNNLLVTRESINAEGIEEVRKYIPSMPPPPEGKELMFAIQHGKLKYVGESETLRRWSVESGIITN